MQAGTNQINGPVFVSISDQIAIHGRFRAADVAFVEGDKQLTWRDYNASANRIADALLGSGVRRGDRVAMLVSNSIWAHEVLLGIWRAGAVAVPLSPMLTAANLRAMLIDSGATYVFASTEYQGLAQSAAEGQQVLTRDGEFQRIVANSSVEVPGFSPAPAELAVIIYSSGTTGTPKGIAHSHQSRLNFALYFAA